MRGLRDSVGLTLDDFLKKRGKFREKISSFSVQIVSLAYETGHMGTYIPIYFFLLRAHTE